MWIVYEFEDENFVKLNIVCIRIYINFENYFFMYIIYWVKYEMIDSEIGVKNFM